MIGTKLRTTSRWAMNVVNYELKNPLTTRETDQMAQFAKVHCGATISSSEKSNELRTVPATELAIDAIQHKPVIGVRVYHEGSAAVLVHLAYF